MYMHNPAEAVAAVLCLPPAIGRYLVSANVQQQASHHPLVHRCSISLPHLLQCSRLSWLALLVQRTSQSWPQMWCTMLFCNALTASSSSSSSHLQCYLRLARAHFHMPSLFNPTVCSPAGRRLCNQWHRHLAKSVASHLCSCP